MSRIHLNIDRLVLNGFEPLEGKALANALQAQMREVLADPGTRAGWARPHRTPVLKLGRMPLEAGTTGATNFARNMAKAVGRGLTP